MPPIGFRVVMVTVNKRIFYLVTVDCRTTVVLITNIVDDFQSRSCLCETSLHLIVNFHCEKAVMPYPNRIPHFYSHGWLRATSFCYVISQCHHSPMEADRRKNNSFITIWKSIGGNKFNEKFFFKQFTLNVLYRIDFHKVMFMVNKYISISLSSTVQPRWFYAQAVLKTTTSTAILATHNVSKLSTIVKITVSIYSRCKKFDVNFWQKFHVYFWVSIRLPYGNDGNYFSRKLPSFE